MKWRRRLARRLRKWAKAIDPNTGTINFQIPADTDALTAAAADAAIAARRYVTSGPGWPE